MSKNKDEQSEDQSTSSRKEIPVICCLASRSRTFIRPKKSPPNNTRLKRPEFSSKSKLQSLETRKQHKTSLPIKSSQKEINFEEEQSSTQSGISTNEGKVFPEPEYVVNDYWKTQSDEVPVQLVEIIKDDMESNDSSLPIKKQKFDLDENEAKTPPYTKEFHMLTEVQKAKIFTAVENAIKKLSNEERYLVGRDEIDRRSLEVVPQTSIERFLCKKFLLPWVIMKVVEMALCHIIQLSFLCDNSYFQRKQEFLPIVVTYYLTLLIIVISLVGHIICFSCSGIQNPCYFMGIISSSILTLTTTLGMFILLSSMEYYKSFLQILVLVFIGVLLCLLFAELCLCYIQVKNIWNRVGQSDQYYIT